MGWRDGTPEKQATGWRSGTAEKEGPSVARARVGGAVQGITGGHFDELASFFGSPLVGGGVEYGPGMQPSPDDTPEVRRLKAEALAQQEAAPSNREILQGDIQKQLDEAQAAHPADYAVSRVGGALLTAPFIARALPATTGLVSAAGTGALLGGINAAGESRASPVRGQIAEYLGDTGKGALLGAGAGGLGYGLTNALTGVAGAVPASMASGGLLGGAQAYMSSDADTVEGRLRDSVLPTLLGMGAAGVAHAGSKLAGATGRATVRGAVKPSEEAQYLRDQGVNNLTIGQMSPGSALGQIEEVGQSAAFVGPKIKAQRAAAVERYGKAAVSQAVPKGGSSLAKGDLNEQLADAYRQQGERYDSVRESPLNPRAEARPVNVKRVGKAFELAANDPDVLTTPTDTQSVTKFLKNQHGLLEKHGATPETLMRVRHNIRQQAASKPEGSAMRQLLGRAEESITNRLNYALPKDAAQTLRDTDADYGTHKIYESAVGRAGDKPMTPNDISAAVKANTDPGAYARGAGGQPREMARAGHEVFDQRAEPTGARLLASGRYNPLPWVARMANSPAIKPYVLGETAAQQRIGDLLGSLGPKLPGMAPISNRLPSLLAEPNARPAYAQDSNAQQDAMEEALAKYLAEQERMAGR